MHYIEHLNQHKAYIFGSNRRNSYGVKHANVIYQDNSSETCIMVLTLLYNHIIDFGLI